MAANGVRDYGFQGTNVVSGYASTWESTSVGDHSVGVYNAGAYTPRATDVGPRYMHTCGSTLW